MRKIPANIQLNDKITPHLIWITDENNSRNLDYLSGIEEHGNALIQELDDPKNLKEVIGP